MIGIITLVPYLTYLCFTSTLTIRIITAAAACHFNEVLSFYVTLDLGGDIWHVLWLDEFLAKRLVQLPLLLHLLVPFVSPDCLSSMLAPCFQAELEEHAGQERVHSGSIAIFKEHELVHSYATPASLLSL